MKESKVFPFNPADSAAAAAWVVNGLQGFAESVVSIVPAGFPAYARVYHPAWRTVDQARTPVRWSEAARANRRVAHRQMQWPGIAGGYPAPPFQNPDQGTLPPEVARPLWQVLAAYTTTAARCWFAVWEGFGCLAADALSGPSFTIPNRRLFLFQAPIEASEASFCEPPLYHQSANLWWPDDRAWCVATEIDFMSTYVAGPAEAITALAARPELEADVVAPGDGVTRASDTLNPAPPADSA